ncbi:MAG: hypothetical protein NW226_03925 [Microscillaceae bacterium]|nr:hypothetical protein [Microscillaceae bacterium]
MIRFFKVSIYTNECLRKTTGIAGTFLAMVINTWENRENFR